MHKTSYKKNSEQEITIIPSQYTGKIQSSLHKASVQTAHYGNILDSPIS